MDFIAEHAPEIFVGIVVIVGALILVLQRLGWLKFETEVVIECPISDEKPFAECEQKMDKVTKPLEKKLNNMDQRLIRLEEGQEYVKGRLVIKGKKIDSILTDVAYIRGYIEKNAK